MPYPNKIDDLMFEDFLGALLQDDDALENYDIPAVKRVATFEERGMMTADRGLVVKLVSGEEFQITIIQSR